MKNFLGGLSFLFLFGITPLVHAEARVYFSPNGGCQEAVITEINKAQKSIDIAMFSITSREIAQALIKAKERGANVKIVLDTSQVKEHFSKGKYLISKGMDVKFHLGPGLMHDKFAVIDGRVLLTGSFNWTASADKKNAENLLIITDRGLAEKYIKQFKHLWGQSGQLAFSYFLHHTGTDAIALNIDHRTDGV
jgi:phosphatidylserine/phosphatidylglycerophosphate/cardiolipin synthase-like enzyme